MVEKIFINGTFDILHVGHLRLFNYAKSLGKILKVSIDSDERVRKLKGNNRPINNQEIRKEFLLNLKPIDHISIFNSDEELIHLIKDYSPDIMIVGSDYKNKKVIGSEYSKSLIFYERIENYSTTQTIQHIINRG